jgi:hypothetical protein
MKKLLIITLFCTFTNTFLNSQVQRAIDGQSIIRDNIIAHSEFNFLRNWSKNASFKSGIGESVVVFPVVFCTPDNRVNLHGLQLNAFVKRQLTSTTYVSSNVSNFAKGFNKDFLYRSIFIDKEDVKRLITYMERDIVPNLKTIYKEQSKEYVYKCKEMFMSFLIDEKDLRITMHIMDYGPLGDGKGGGEQIEFWTESQVDKIPVFLNSLKEFHSKMN